MKVATWNLGLNTGFSAATSAVWLAEQACDIALLQEVNLDTLDFAAVAPCTGAWGSAISTKYPAQRVEVSVQDELRSWLRIAAADVVIDGTPHFVASVHPHYDAVEPVADCDAELRRYSLAGARWLWHCDIVFGVLNEIVADRKRFIIGGDWNTARAFQNSSVPDARFSVAFFERAERAGWRELGLHEDGTEQPTFRERGTGYQLDHLFVDRETRRHVESVTVHSEVLESGLSDHAPIVAEFQNAQREGS